MIITWKKPQDPPTTRGARFKNETDKNALKIAVSNLFVGNKVCTTVVISPSSKIFSAFPNSWWRKPQDIFVDGHIGTRRHRCKLLFLTWFFIFMPFFNIVALLVGICMHVASAQIYLVAFFMYGISRKYWRSTGKIFWKECWESTKGC